VAYPTSDRQLEEMMEQRSVEVERSTLNRRAVEHAPWLDQRLRTPKRANGTCRQAYAKV
jgi:transposase-like protein